MQANKFCSISAQVSSLIDISLGHLLSLLEGSKDSVSRFSVCYQVLETAANTAASPRPRQTQSWEPPVYDQKSGS